MLNIFVICAVGVLGILILKTKQKEKEPQELNSVALAKEKLLNEKMIEEERKLGNVVIAAQKRYHREDCKFVDKSNQLMTIVQAKSRGLKPCKRCRPN